MSAGLTIWRCDGCGTRYFPARLLCPRCGGASFTKDRADTAVVKEVSVIHHMLGQDNWQPRRIANVSTPDGLHLTIGLRDQSEPGATVELCEEGGAPFGQSRLSV